jgi:hypothetical protein
MEIDPDVVLEGPLNSWMTGFSLTGGFESCGAVSHADNMINKKNTRPFTEARVLEYDGYFRLCISILGLRSPAANSEATHPLKKKNIPAGDESQELRSGGHCGRVGLTRLPSSRRVAEATCLDPALERAPGDVGGFSGLHQPAHDELIAHRRIEHARRRRIAAVEMAQFK